MKKALHFFLSATTAFMQLHDAFAGNSTITTKDASGATQTFAVTTNGTGSFLAQSTLCDQSAAALCASIGTAGAPSTNALTIQAVTLGHGTAANAMRVELPTDGTGQVVAVNSTASLLNATVVNAGTFAVQATLSAETTKVIGTVRNLGNAGAIFDGATGAAVPANVLYMGANQGGNLAGLTSTSGNLNVGQATAANLNATVVGLGTAGTASGGVLTVQGVASMTPVQVSQATAASLNATVVNAGTFAVQLSGATNNINNISGTVSLPTGAATAALQATNTATTSHTCSVSGYSILGCLGQIDDDVRGAIPAGTNRIGYTSDDPCATATKTTIPFSTSSSGPVSLIALSGTTRIYVCSISAITDTASKLSFIDGNSASCATTQHAIWGSTTASVGMSLAANGGFTQGAGAGTVGLTAAASAFCLLQSGTSLIAGNVSYVQQ